MAQKTRIEYVSDLSGKAITDNDSPTITFAWDGQEYAIDLTAKEAETFFNAIEKYIASATKVTNRRRSSRSKAKQSGPSAQELREWAKSQGMDVPDRGRIPQSVRDAWESASK